jgi:periplasmic protein TonB
MQLQPNAAAARGRGPTWWRWAAAAAAVATAAWVVWWFLGLESTPQPQRKVTQIAVLRPPPPPPPPKTPEKPPEPPKVKEEVKLDPPKPVDEPKPADAPKDAPPPGPLGVDAQGTGPGDGFGLTGRPGGRDITLGASGGGGLNHSLFANGVARHIAQELARQAALRSVEYRVELRVWIGRDGRIERWELARGSGDAALDRALTDGLARVGSLRQPAPDGMAQPLRIRVTSADA